MRRFVPTILKLSVLMLAVLVITQQVGATKTDVERALDLLKQARAAIGGDAAINSVQNLSATGKTRRQVQIPNEAMQEMTGDFELAMMLPDRMMKMEKLTLGSKSDDMDKGTGEQKEVKIKEHQVRIVRGNDGGERGESADLHDAMRHHERAEIARYMLGLLLNPPASIGARYNYLGEGDVGGAAADILEAQGSGGFMMKLYLDKSSHLPLMMTYQGMLPRIPIARMMHMEGPVGEGADDNVIVIRRQKDGDTKVDGADGQIIFERKLSDAGADGEKTMMLENAEIQIRFSDFRAVGGVLLPHTLTQYVGGKLESVWTVDGYELNSPNINQKFQRDFLIRTKQN
jgi:hypothetical protein